MVMMMDCDRLGWLRYIPAATQSRLRCGDREAAQRGRQCQQLAPETSRQQREKKTDKRLDMRNRRDEDMHGGQWDPE